MINSLLYKRKKAHNRSGENCNYTLVNKKLPNRMCNKLKFTLTYNILFHFILSLFHLFSLSLLHLPLPASPPPSPLSIFFHLQHKFATKIICYCKRNRHGHKSLPLRHHLPFCFFTFC